MEKCPYCNRKAKRSCLLENITAICSKCCGEIRKEATCFQCSYYKPQRRNYKQIPRYTVCEMQDSLVLNDISCSIESALHEYDYNSSQEIKDPIAIRIIELLIDRYYFGDASPKEKNETILEGF